MFPHSLRPHFPHLPHPIHTNNNVVSNIIKKVLLTTIINELFLRQKTSFIFLLLQIRLSAAVCCVLCVVCMCLYIGMYETETNEKLRTNIMTIIEVDRKRAYGYGADKRRWDKINEDTIRTENIHLLHTGARIYANKKNVRGEVRQKMPAILTNAKPKSIRFSVFCVF